MPFARSIAHGCFLVAGTYACGNPGPTDAPDVASSTNSDAGTPHVDGRDAGGGDDDISILPDASVDSSIDASALEPVCRSPDGRGDVMSLAAGAQHACFVRAGEIWCWGTNTEGQLGDGQPASAHDVCGVSECAKRPVRVLGISDAIQVTAGGATTCALRRNGHVACWGYGLMGQLGDGVATHTPCASASSLGSSCARAPVEVAGLTDAIEVAIGDEHVCALRVDRSIVCWGNNWEGQLGAASASTSTCQAGTSIEYPCARAPVAVAVGPLDTVSAGGVTTCGIASGTVWCWGSNEFGENGNGLPSKTSSPVRVTGLTDAVQIRVGYHHSCALRKNGRVVCWGWAMDGELGDGQSTHPSCADAPCASTPVEVTGLIDAVAIDGSFTHVCAIRANGTAVCWGDDRSGQIGDGPTSDACKYGACRLSPSGVTGMSDLATIATGAHFGLFVTKTCDLWGTGNNVAANLGTGDVVSRDAPVRATEVGF